MMMLVLRSWDPSVDEMSADGRSNVIPASAVRRPTVGQGWPSVGRPTSIDALGRTADATTTLDRLFTE